MQGMFDTSVRDDVVFNVYICIANKCSVDKVLSQ